MTVTVTITLTLTPDLPAFGLGSADEAESPTTG